MLWVTMRMVTLVLEFVDQFLDAGGGDRIERRGGFVEQQDFRVGGQRARDAQALLLAAGQVDRPARAAGP